MLASAAVVYLAVCVAVALYGWGEVVESNAIEFLIHTIRKKLGATAIRNVRGVGWMVDRS